ncbi:MAG: hypothetical protein HW390_2059 [Candidatus Brocadiaceae bacterium]|nr:hypothetical protein [Candidatus Brocadiaceae bacterium]
MINRAIGTHEIAPIVRTMPTVAMPINCAVTRLPQPATVVTAPIMMFFLLAKRSGEMKIISFITDQQDVGMVLPFLSIPCKKRGSLVAALPH